MLCYLRKRLYFCLTIEIFMKRVTIIDIATALGITPSTVSRALTGSSRVGESTRQKVQEKAEELGYRTNVVASSLRRGRSDTVGMLVPRINRNFFSHVISAVEEVLNPAGYNLLICQSHERFDIEKQSMKVLLNNRVAGIIISHAMESESSEVLDLAVADRVPFVQFDRVFKGVSGPVIINDNFSGAYMAVKHLMKSGYRRIAHFTGSLKVNIYQERYKGYMYAMEEASLPTDDMVFKGAITRDTAYEVALNIIRQKRIDAIFCAGDYSALGVINALNDSGLRVGGDIGVAGFANEPFAALISPGLTSVEQNAYDMGHRAARALIRSISGTPLPSVFQEEIVPVRLLVRASSMRESDARK